MADPQTIEDLGRLVKQKYPGSYDAYPDADVGRRMQSKYPGAYAQFQDAPAAAPAATPTAPGADARQQFNNVPPPSPPAKPGKQPKHRLASEDPPITPSLGSTLGREGRSDWAAHERNRIAAENLVDAHNAWLQQQGEQTADAERVQTQRKKEWEGFQRDYPEAAKNVAPADIADFILRGNWPTSRSSVLQKIPNVRPPAGTINTATGKEFGPNELATKVIDSSGNVDYIPTGSPRTGSPRTGKAVTLDNAAALQKQGVQTFPDVNGNEIDISKVPPNMVLAETLVGDRLYYRAVTPEEYKTVIGNEAFLTSHYNMQGIVQGTVAPAGVERTGQAGTNQQLAVDPNTGQLTVNTLETTSTPRTPGPNIQRPAGAAAPPAGAPPPPAQQPAQTPRPPTPAAPAAATPRPQAQTTPPVNAPQPTRGNIRGLPPAQYQRAQTDVAPVRVGVTQLFGDPANPGFQSFSSYADLADDKGSQQRMGTAYQLVMKGLSVSPGGHISVGAEGGAGVLGAQVDGLLALLTNWAGLPAALSASEQAQFKDVYSRMSQRERDALSMEFQALSTVVGLRRLTGASAAQFSTTALERDVPAIGINVFGTPDFKTKMSALAEDVKTGAQGKLGFTPEEMQRINQLPTEAQKIGGKKAQSTGQYKKGDVARSPGKPDLYYDGTKWGTAPVQPDK